MDIWRQNCRGTSEWQYSRDAFRGAFRTWKKAVYGHANVLVNLLRNGFSTGDGGADTPARALAVKMHAREMGAQEQRQERRTRDEQELANFKAFMLWRDVRFRSLRREDLTSAQEETLRKLKAGELTCRQAEPKVDIGTKLARLLGAS